MRVCSVPPWFGKGKGLVDAQTRTHTLYSHSRSPFQARLGVKNPFLGGDFSLVSDLGDLGKRVQVHVETILLGRIDIDALEFIE